MIKEMENIISRVNDFTTTENGAVSHKTTGSKLVDLNFRIPSMRNEITTQDLVDFAYCLNTNKEYAVKWLFYLRDARFGIGERDTFITLYKVFYETFREDAINCLKLISEYGRWKDVVDLCFSGNENLKVDCMDIIVDQLKKDVDNLTNGVGISLLPKWLPSINATKKARVQAKEICKYLGMSYCSYRKMLSKLRKYLDVTEVKTCSNRWGEIDYNKVSSNANLKYADAFLKHDEERRHQYLVDILNQSNKNVKMNASLVFPHEIWSKYTKDTYTLRGEDTIKVYDMSLEAMWKNLKDFESCGNTLCVVDGSGSMTAKANGVMPLNIARSLGVYFAERCTGEFHNTMIEFSSSPKIIDINGCNNLMEKINKVSKYTDCSNTNIEKTFMLILETAVKYNMKQEDMPERILVISDMEFDSSNCDISNEYKTLFDTIEERFEAKGYKIPKLVFWNVNSRTNAIPVTQNEFGVILVSGYSVNLVNLVMSGQTDPWFALKEVLDSNRYSQITEKLQ